jgi:trk system potassium uptake protein TrkH
MPRRDDSLFPASLAIVTRDVGDLLRVVGGIMMVPAIVAAIYREPYAGAACLAGGIVAILVGQVLGSIFRDAPEAKMRHAMVTAGAGWLAVALMGAIPYLLAAHWTPDAVIASHVPQGVDHASSLHNFRNPLHAVFESMSGFTTTGLTMSVHEPTLPQTLLFYRSFSQWVGGAGVVVLALAILRPAAGVGGYSLYRSEARERRVRPSIVGTARSIAGVYVAVTLLVAAYLASVLFLLQPGYGVEQTLFDALNHAMTGQATGGFSTLDDSIAGYNSYAVELAHILPMVLGAVALPLYYLAYTNRDLRVLTKDPQVRTLFTLLVLGIPTMCYLLARGVVPLPDLPSQAGAAAATLASSEAVRAGLFQYASALTGTGWQTAPTAPWSGAAILVLVVFAMNIGGCAGSTTGGVKLIRAYLVGKGVRWQVSRVFLPRNAVQRLEVGDRNLGIDEINEEMRSAGLMVLAYHVLLVGGIILASAAVPDMPFRHALFEVASALGTVGLSSGVTGPEMSSVVEVSFVFLMWVGRLEIFPVLAFLRSLVGGMSFR